MITAVQTTPDGKVAFRFGADVFPVTKHEEQCGSPSRSLRRRRRIPSETTPQGGILLTWLPGCYQQIGWSDAEELYHQIGDAIWMTPRRCGMSGDVFKMYFPVENETRESST